MPDDKLLFTPGPLTTSRTVKEAMLRDLGSRDAEFIATVQETRDELLRLAGTSQAGGYEAVIMQGSGTFGLESMVSSVIPADGTLLVLINGAYGERIAAMGARHGISTEVLRVAENRIIEPAAVAAALDATPAVTHVCVVHCETTTGILNPVEAIGQVVHAHGADYLVDSMSAFGAVEVDVAAWHVDFLVSSSNKCIEGVPGFAFVICRRDSLLETEGRARTMSLDLLAQWQGLEKSGQFRFTPPTHVLLAFRQALRELEDEGGPPGRERRYRGLQRVLLEGMTALGFDAYLPRATQGPIITTFHEPTDPAFRFEDFYRRLSDRGLVIYPGKLTQAACFRIGTVGRLGTSDVQRLLDAIREVLDEMGVIP